MEEGSPKPTAEADKNTQRDSSRVNDAIVIDKAQSSASVLAEVYGANKLPPGTNIPKKRKSDVQKGKKKSKKSKHQDEDVSDEVGEADDGARADSAESSPPRSSDHEVSDDSSEDSSVESSSDEEGDSEVDVEGFDKPGPSKSQAKVSAKQSYERFDPGIGDRVVFTLKNQDMVKYITKLFTSYVPDKKIKESICDEFPVPTDVPGLEVPVVDQYISDIFHSRKQDYGKAVDDIWVKTQHRLLDVTGPLSKLWSILEGVRLEETDEELDLFDCLSLVEKVITLVGQTFITMNHNRQQNILYKMTKDLKQAKSLLRQWDVSDMRKFDKLFGKNFYSKLRKSAKVRKISKDISSQFSEGKQKPKQQSSSKGGGEDQPFRQGPPSNNRGGGRKVAFRRRGRGSGNRGKCLVRFVCKQSKNCSDRQTKKVKCTLISPKSKVKHLQTDKHSDCRRTVGFDKQDRRTRRPSSAARVVPREDLSTRQSGGQPKVMPVKLAETDKGLLCPESGGGIRNSPDQLAFPTCRATSVSILPQGDGAGGDRSGRHVGEGGNHSGDTLQPSVCEPSLSCPQERRVPEACNQLKTVEFSCSVRTFQDGGAPSVERSCSTQRFHGESRSQGRLFQCPSEGGPLSLPEISLGKETLPVYMHAFRSRSSTEDFHENHETDCSFPKTSWSPDNNLSGRHDYLESRQSGVEEGPQLATVLADAIRLCYKLEEVSTETDPDLRVLGVHDRHYSDENVSPRGEDSKAHSEMSEINFRQNSEGQGGGRDHRPVHLLGEGYSTCTPPLPSLTDGPDQGLSSGQLIRSQSVPITGGSDRVTVVGGQYSEMEWQSHHHSISGYDNRYGRFSQRLGSCLETPEDRWCLESDGGPTPHKCVRVNRGPVCSEGFCQKPPERPCPSQNGQCLGCHLHPKDGGDEIRSVTGSSTDFMGLLSAEEHSAISRVSSWPSERPSRLGIQAQLGFERLDVRPPVVSDYQSEMGSPDCGLICHQTQCPTETVRQLEARPIRVGSGCFHDGMEQGKTIPVSTIFNDNQVSSQGLQGLSHSGDSNSHLAVPTLVPHLIRDGNCQSNTATSDERHAKISKRRRPPVNGPVRPTVSGVESVRQQALSRGISTDAANLLAEFSWRKGTKCTYESAWRQWSCWSLSRQIDPVCSSVESVVNYLSDRYNKGDQYNTLNIHRSAISAFHSLVDNIKVGQHPVVTSMMSAFFNARPPLPRYEYTWDVDVVLNYISSLGDNKNIALKQLTLKLTMLCALACAGRSSDLHAFDTRYMRLEDDKVVFSLAELTKSRRRGKPPISIEIHHFEDDTNLCVLTTLLVYLDRTKIFRERNDGARRNQVLLSFVEPHKAVVPCTIAGWLIKIMTEAGIDTQAFKAHSTRGAATSKAAAMGLSCKEILNMAKWKRQSTFTKHYHKKIVAQAKNCTRKFESVVLAS